MATGKTNTRKFHITSNFEVKYDYSVYFERNIFETSNTRIIKILSPSRLNPSQSKLNPKVLFVADESILKTTKNLTQKIKAYFNYHNVDFKLITTPGSEIVKDGFDSLAKTIITSAHSFKIDRQNYIIALGGGALLDAVGFTASIFHRGVRFIRIPTTTLSQCDAAVGVKNGIDFLGQKNLLGVFAPPHAVINDSEFLKTLPYNNWIEGYAEALKVSSIKNEKAFNALTLTADVFALRNEEIMDKLIQFSSALHMQHIAEGGDPFEAGSARPLDLGHWSAHYLEEKSNFKLTHGTAVAIGLLIDFKYAQRSKWIDRDDFDSLLTAFKTTGFLKNFKPFANLLNDGKAVLSGLESFRQHLGGELTLTFPSPIGSSREVHTINKTLMLQCISFVHKICEKEKD